MDFGNPAKIIRKLTSKEIMANKENACTGFGIFVCGRMVIGVSSYKTWIFKSKCGIR